MRKVAGAVSAVAFMAAAAAIWSGLATTAAGRVTAPDVGTPPRLAPSTANNQPLPADFIRQPAAAERGTKVGFRAEMGSAGECSWQQWPFMGSDCFVSMTKPSRETNALSAPEPRVEAPAAPVAAPAPSAAAAPPVAAPTAAAPAPVAAPRAAAVAPAPQPAPVAKPVPVAPAVAAPAPVTPAVTRAPASCPQTLAAAGARMERAIAAVRSGRPNETAETCAAFRRNFFEVVQAREVTALCKTGADRVQELDRIDVALDNINGTIAKSCGG